MSKTRFGILGCGSAAVPVCEAIASSSLAALTRVHDLDLALARDLGERYGAPYTGQLDELLSDATVDAVYIAVPHSLLAPLSKQVLGAGKHVLVEKPMALTLAQADEMIALADERRLALGVFYELRYATAFVQARELIRAGAIGEVIAVRVQTLISKAETYWQVGYSGRSANPWRGEKAKAGGGVVLMNTSHLLDAVGYMTGLEVVRVSAEIGTLVASVEVEDTAAAALRFNNGAIGSLIAGAHIPGAKGDERLDLVGTQGQLKLPDPYGAEPLHVFLRRAWGDVPANTWYIVPGAKAQVYAGAIEAFARAVQSGEPAPTNGRDARRVLKTVLALYQAAAEKRTITLRESEAAYA
jgi:predicted dehydrogenase